MTGSIAESASLSLRFTSKVSSFMAGFQEYERPIDHALEMIVSMNYN